MYIKCKYANLTEFGLTCKYSVGPMSKDSEYPCPKDSGTDRNRNGICYSYCKFEKDDRPLYTQDLLNILYKRQKEIFESIKVPEEIENAEDIINALRNGGKLSELNNLLEIVESMAGMGKIHLSGNEENSNRNED